MVGKLLMSAPGLTNPITLNVLVKLSLILSTQSLIWLSPMNKIKCLVLSTKRFYFRLPFLFEICMSVSLSPLLTADKSFSENFE